MRSLVLFLRLYKQALNFQCALMNSDKKRERERERKGEREKARERETESCCTNTTTHLSDPFPARSPDSNRNSSLITIHNEDKVD